MAVKQYESPWSHDASMITFWDPHFRITGELLLLSDGDGYRNGWDIFGGRDISRDIYYVYIYIYHVLYIYHI